MRINNNLMAANATRQLSVNNGSASKSMEKLSSGYRINRAGDDAAGLAISEKMRGQIRGLNQASKNAQDGISLLQTAEGGLNETHSILQRMRELAVQGSNDTLQTEDRAAVQTEMDELTTEVDRIATTTKFNGATLLNGHFGVKLADATSNPALDGTLNDVANTAFKGLKLSGAMAGTTYTLDNSAAGELTLDDGNGNTQTISGLGDTFTGTLNFDKLGITIKAEGAATDGDGTTDFGGTIITSGLAADKTVNIQIGADSGQNLGIEIGDMTASGLGIDKLSVSSYTSANGAIDSIQTAIDTVASTRSKLGAWSNRLEHTINNLGTSAENLQAAESRIKDVDMAAEMVEYTKNDILQQAAQAMLAKANQAPQGVLQLLR